MRSIVILISLALAATGPSLGQTGQNNPPPKAEAWSVGEREIVSLPSRISFPRAVGTLSAYRTMEFSHQGEALDTGIQYRSADETVFATVYVYYPALTHAGLTAFATDEAMRRNSDRRLSSGPARIVAAAGVEGSAIRRDYENYHGGLVSSAAFLRADRWLIKLRVSGPQARRAEVNAAMDALLAGARFDAAAPPRAAQMIEIADCAPGTASTPANPVPDTANESAAQIMVVGLDGGGASGTDQSGAHHYLPSRLPDRFCLSSRAHVGELVVPILRAEGGPALGLEGRTALLAVINDAGQFLEVVRPARSDHYVLLRHAIGETLLAGSFDRVPTDEQIVTLLNGPPSESTRVRARLRMRPGQNDVVEMVTPPSPEAPTT